MCASFSVPHHRRQIQGERETERTQTLAAGEMLLDTVRRLSAAAVNVKPGDRDSLDCFALVASVFLLLLLAAATLASMFESVTYIFCSPVDISDVKQQQRVHKTSVRLCC